MVRKFQRKTLKQNPDSISRALRAIEAKEKAAKEKTSEEKAAKRKSEPEA